MKHTTTLTFLVITLAIIFPSSVSCQTSRSLHDRTPDSQAFFNQMKDNLARAQELIKAGRIPDALGMLDEVMRAATALSNENLILKESVLWQVATAHLDFSQELTNPAQYKREANIARERWKDYIRWYDQLSDSEKASLPSAHVRINTATRHLGNALLRSHDQRLLLDEYTNVSKVEYLGIDAMDLWKNTLYQCPNWQAVNEQTLEVRKKKICTEECMSDWLAYADTLAEWATRYNLRQAARDRYLREVDQIRNTSKECSSRGARALK